MTCPHCQTVNPANARFCFNCGQPMNLVTQTDEARLSRLAAATPLPLADKMRAAHLVGERKLVTCLFADVVGSTALAEGMDPDDWTAIMNHAFDRLSPVVYRYEGTIARLMGDAILAFFGAPVAHEDDAVRAALTALDMLAAARSYAEEVRRQHHVEFAIRVGLNTGNVVVGNVGSDLKYEYTAMGDAVNLAARMQSAARPMTVLISEHTQRFIAPVFDCADVGLVEVKGKSEPVQVFEVRGPKTQPSRVRGLAGFESPMVGRDAELAVLLSAGAALEGAAAHGTAVAIVGEPGLGKSRLLAEWKSRAAHVRWAEGRCLSYGHGLAYHLLIDLLRSLMGVAATAAEPEMRAALLALTYAQAATYPYLAHLLSLELAGDDLERVNALDPQTLQSNYYKAMAALLRELAARQPLGLICEDVHWADPSSVALLANLLPLGTEAPLLFCFVTRPDTDAPGWALIDAAQGAFDNHFIRLNLLPLTEAHSRQLVTNLLEVEALPDHIRAIILQKAEGNPFFVEEVIRMLIDQGAIAQHGTRWSAAQEAALARIPDNLQGLLAARIDRLVDEAKRTLRVAAVIGRQFAVRILDQIVAATRQLPLLESSGFIHPEITVPELEYLFRHALMQEAAYNSLVKQDRKDLHRRVGQALERTYPERTGELASLLGRHFLLGGDNARALNYFTQAGDSAFAAYANAEAVMHYGQSIELAGACLIGNEALLHLFSRRGRALELISRFEEALANYRNMETAARARGDKKMELAALTSGAIIYSTANPAHNPEQGRAMLERAIPLARELGDRAAEARILWAFSLNNLVSVGDPRQRADYGEQAVALARELNLREQLAFALSDLWYAYAGRGETGRERAVVDEACALWRELGNLPMLATTVTSSALTHLFAGEYDAALARSDEAFKLGRDANNLDSQAICRALVGAAHLERGDFDRAIQFMQAAIAVGEPVKNLSVGIFTQADLGWVFGQLGAYKHAFRLASAAEEHAAQTLTIVRPWPVAVRVRLHVRQGNLARAEALTDALADHLNYRECIAFMAPQWIHSALALAELAYAKGELPPAAALLADLCAEMRRRKVRLYYATALNAHAQVLHALGDTSAARAALDQARAEAEALGARWPLWQTLALLGSLENEAGRAALATQLHTEARALLQSIADTVPA
nr:AAA family ATPase [Chloroflexota bacterium]